MSSTFLDFDYIGKGKEIEGKKIIIKERKKLRAKK